MVQPAKVIQYLKQQSPRQRQQQLNIHKQQQLQIKEISKDIKLFFDEIGFC